MKASEQVLLRFLWQRVWAHKRLLIMSAVLALGIAAIEIKLLSLVRRFIDDALTQAELTQVVGVAVLLVILMGLDGIIRFSHRFALRVALERTIQRLREEIFDKFLVFSRARLHQAHSSQASANILSDVSALGHANHLISDAMKEPLVFAGLLGYLFFLNWKLSLVCLLCLPFIAWVAKRLGQSARRNQSRLQQSLEHIYQNVSESVQGVETSHVFHVGSALRGEFQKSTQLAYQYLIKLARLDEAVGPITKFTSAIIGALLLVFGGYWVVNGTMTAGTLITFITTAAMLQQPIRQLNTIHLRLQQVLAATERIYRVCHAPLDTISTDQLSALGHEGASQVLIEKNSVWRCHEVSFQYPQLEAEFSNESTGQRPWALQNISIRIEPGKSYALVGKSGSGKSTLSALILRFLDPTQGSVFLNERNARDWPIHDYRKHFALVPQNPFFFQRSIRENLLMANPRAQDSDLWDALQLAALNEVIRRLPGQLDYVLGENANLLSGGERQRLAIARAVLKPCPILIFDEATANLDAENELIIQQSLKKISERRTLIVIAHRFSTLRQVDHVFVFDQGLLVEQGSPSQLKQSGGAFDRLWKLQELQPFT